MFSPTTTPKPPSTFISAEPANRSANHRRDLNFGSAIGGGLLTRGITRLETLQANSNTGGSSYEWGKMAEHTLGSTGSRLIVSDSLVESVEIAITETIEGLVVFFGLSGLVNKYFAPLTNKLAGINTKQEKELAKHTLKEMPVKALAKQLPARLAAIVGAIGTTLFLGEFGMLFGKNLFTAGVFGKGSFSEVIALDNKVDQKKLKSTVERSKKGLAISIGAALATLGSALVIAKKGPAIAKKLASGRLEKLRKVLTNKTLPMDFTVETRKGKKVFGLNKGQLALYMGLSGLGYLISARDNLERWEIGPRFALIFGYLVAFKDVFDNKVLFPYFQKRLPQLFKKDGDGNRAVKSYEELAPEIAKAGNTQAKKLRRGKNALFLAPYVVGMALVSLANAALNRYFTYQRFERQQQAQAQERLSKLAPLSHTV